MAANLPPLNALRAFEAVARHLHLGKAAEELHVTSGAVSQQIRQLEDYLDVELFVREGRGLRLTEAAERALPSLQQGFASLVESTRILRAKDHTERLSIWAPPSFASKWLLPRLPHFSRRHPEIDFEIRASESMIERGNSTEHAVEQIRRQKVDVAFVFGDGFYPGFSVDELFDVNAIPVCSPSLRAGNPPLTSPADLRFHTLLHDETDYHDHPTWNRWLQNAGIQGVNTRRGIRFSQLQLAIDAAIERQGVLLALDVLVQRDISAGRLCVPFGPAIQMDPRYLMVCQKQRLKSPSVQAFRNWILGQVTPVDTEDE
ncbi:MAG: transcriptional regulator GcvA [Gammaproteobacteria bacterium]|nr:transcriptional regulator GcvA [Gammaproteobacteria bacterium]